MLLPGYGKSADLLHSSAGAISSPHLWPAGTPRLMPFLAFAGCDVCPLQEGRKKKISPGGLYCRLAICPFGPVFLQSWHTHSSLHRDAETKCLVIALTQRKSWSCSGYSLCLLSSRGLDRQEIAKQLNANEWRVKITLGNVRRLSRRQIAHALDDLYYLDYQIKSGQINRFYGLELFLINFPN